MRCILAFLLLALTLAGCLSVEVHIDCDSLYKESEAAMPLGGTD